jgi:hypothetical protein
LYKVTAAQRTDEDVILTVNSGSFGEDGFAYMRSGLKTGELPGGLPGTVVAQPLGDGWYSWEWSGD